MWLAQQSFLTKLVHVLQAEARLDALAEDEAQLQTSLRDLHQKQVSQLGHTIELISGS